MTSARASVPVPLVYGGIAAIIALLVAVGYFAGRASTGEAVRSAPAAAPVAASTLVPAAAPPAAVSVARGPEAAAPLGTPVVAVPAPAAHGAPAAAAVAPAVQHAVAEYFRQMDATQSAAKSWSDPNALAQEVLSQAMRGDSSGFDKLVAATAAARDGVRGITAPLPCAEHHRLTLALLDDAVVMLSKLRDGVAAGDPSAVASIATSGGDLEGRARAVDTLAASLRAQYGVAAAP